MEKKQLLKQLSSS